MFRGMFHGFTMVYYGLPRFTIVVYYDLHDVILGYVGIFLMRDLLGPSRHREALIP